MGKDVKNLAQSLLGAAKAKGFDTAQISAIMDSPEGHVLLVQPSIKGLHLCSYLNPPVSR